MNGDYFAAGEVFHRPYYLHASEDYAIFFNGHSWEISETADLGTKMQKGFILNKSNFCISDLASAKFVNIFDNDVLDTRLICGSSSFNINPRFEASMKTHDSYVQYKQADETAVV